MRRSVVVVFFLSFLLASSAPAAERPSRWRGLWHVSQALLAGGEAADAASSWGKNEANPLVRAGQRFSYGSMIIKLGTLSTGLAAQHYIVRHHPEYAPGMTLANFGAAGMLGVVAARNMRIPRPQ